MRLSPIAALLVSSVLLIAACEEMSPPLVPAPAPPPPPPPAETAAVAVRPAPPPVDSNPTVLGEQDRARDRALAAGAAAIVDAYPNFGSPFSSLVGTFARDNKRFLFGSGRAGVPEIYLGDATRPGEAPREITRGPERAIWASFTRDDKFILFTRDEGADENWGIYRAAPDGSSPTLLTPAAKVHRDEPLLPRKKPDLMIYTSHVNSSPASQLVVQPISGGAPRTVYEDPAPAFAADVTDDGARALLLRWRSASDLILFEVETAGGKAARVYPREGTRATITNAAYSADQRTVYVATDEGQEGSALLALDARTHAVTARWAVDEPRTAAIAGLAVSPRGDRLAVALDAGNRTEIRILDARKLTPQRKLEMPLGLGGVGLFTPDGKAFSFWVSTPSQPADAFLADAATGKVRPLRQDRRAGVDELPPLTVSIEKTTAHDGLTLPINLYLPRVEPGKKLPIIVAFHGGPSSSYAVRWSPITRFFTARGYAVAEPNIRGSTGFGRAYEMADNREKRADAIKDMATVNAWAKAQPWCDPSRVVMFGGSYGGYLTLMAVTRQPTLWRAGVDLFGIPDLKSFLRTTDQAIRAGFVDEFGDLDKDGALLDEFSPSRDYDKIVAPLFVYAGQNDPRVPRSQSDQIVVALRGRGVPVEYMVAAAEGHSIDRRETKIELFTRLARFLEDHAR